MSLFIIIDLKSKRVGWKQAPFIRLTFKNIKHISRIIFKVLNVKLLFTYTWSNSNQNFLSQFQVELINTNDLNLLNHFFWGMNVKVERVGMCSVSAPYFICIDLCINHILQLLSFWVYYLSLVCFLINNIILLVLFIMLYLLNRVSNLN